MKRFFLIVLITLGLASCDLLNTRTPESPNSSRNSYIPATTPDILFSNFTGSFKDKVVENYMACLVDSSFLKRNYKFVPTAEAASQYSILNDWRIEYEEEYFKHLANKTENSQIIVTLEETQKSISGDSASFQFDYTISFSIQDESIETNYQGSMILKILIDSQQQWVITEWDDIKKENFPSWSELKGRFYL